MTDNTQRWQTKIWIGEKVDEPVTLYGKSLKNLEEVATTWLRENKPQAFGNAPPEFDLSKRFNYAYSDGTKVPAFPLGKFLAGEAEPLDEGWYGVSGASGYPWLDHFKDFEEVVSHFIEHSLIPEKGPDFKEIALVEGNLPLHLIKTIKRESKELQINDMLQRGWHIIAIEYSGRTTDYSEKLVERKATFVLGHSEENAF